MKQVEVNPLSRFRGLDAWFKAGVMFLDQILTDITLHFRQTAKIKDQIFKNVVSLSHENIQQDNQNQLR